MTSFEQNFRIVVERIFNHWPNLKLAVEHGMGGRNGQQTAIQVMNYTYDYCIGNEKITQGELQDILEDLMDQEFNTLCDDNSIPEICRNLLRYLHMCREEKYSEIDEELKLLPPCNEWLSGDIKIMAIGCADSSCEESDENSSDSQMDVDESSPCPSKNVESNKSNEFVEPEAGWTTVRSKK